jgi:excisionase family DNA binding protein
MPNAWLTVAEASDYLKIRPRTLLAWVREGAVKGYPLHGCKRRVWRFRVEDLDCAMGYVAVPGSAGVLVSQSSSAVLQ